MICKPNNIARQKFCAYFVVNQIRKGGSNSSAYDTYEGNKAKIIVPN